MEVRKESQGRYCPASWGSFSVITAAKFTAENAAIIFLLLLLEAKRLTPLFDLSSSASQSFGNNRLKIRGKKCHYNFVTVIAQG